MKFKIDGNPSFSHIKFVLSPGDSITTESDAMASMDTDIDHKTAFNGGFFKGLLKKFLGGESLFINHYTNNSDKDQEIVITQPTPGEIHAVKLEGRGMYLQPGSYICSTPDVHLVLEWAGIRSFIAREGLFRLYVGGKGVVWFGGYGRILERDLDGETLTDTSHLLAYEPSINLNIQLSGGLVSSLMSGEGLLTRMEGKGRIFIQSRSIHGLASWLNPKL